MGRLFMKIIPYASNAIHTSFNHQHQVATRAPQTRQRGPPSSAEKKKPRPHWKSLYKTPVPVQKTAVQVKSKAKADIAMGPGLTTGGLRGAKSQKPLAGKGSP